MRMKLFTVYPRQTTEEAEENVNHFLANDDIKVIFITQSSASVGRDGDSDIVTHLCIFYEDAVEKVDVPDEEVIAVEIE